MRIATTRITNKPDFQKMKALPEISLKGSRSPEDVLERSVPPNGTPEVIASAALYGLSGFTLGAPVFLLGGALLGGILPQSIEAGLAICGGVIGGALGLGFGVSRAQNSERDGQPKSLKDKILDGVVVGGLSAGAGIVPAMAIEAFIQPTSNLPMFATLATFATVGTVAGAFMSEDAVSA